MTIREIINRGKCFRNLIKRGVELRSYPTIPLSSLTAVSDLQANERFAPEEPNSYANSTQTRELVQRLLDNMSKSRAKVILARTNARLNPTA